MNLQYRQGDLLFFQQETPPSRELTRRPGNVIVAGEATGHAHRLTSGTIPEAPDGALYLEVTHSAQVVDEEHGPLSLDPGWWLVVRQREYRPTQMESSTKAAQAFRTVAD